MSVGHVDGGFDPRSRAFVLQYVESIVMMREQSSMEPADVRARLSASLRAYFAELDRDLSAELVVLAPDRLRGRVLTMFRGLSWNDQATALELIHGLLHSDGSFTPSELALYDELRAAFVVVSAAPASMTAKKAGPKGFSARSIQLTLTVASMFIDWANHEGHKVPKFTDGIDRPTVHRGRP